MIRDLRLLLTGAILGAMLRDLAAGVRGFLAYYSHGEGAAHGDDEAAAEGRAARHDHEAPG